MLELLNIDSNSKTLDFKKLRQVVLIFSINIIPNLLKHLKSMLINLIT